MKTYEAIVVVPKNMVEIIDDYLCNDYSQDPDSTITYTARFLNGFEMDIKCCGSSEEEPSWTEAVLFDGKGNQIVYTDVEEEFFGEWELENNGILYKVNVIPE